MIVFNFIPSTLFFRLKCKIYIKIFENIFIFERIITKKKKE